MRMRAAWCWGSSLYSRFCSGKRQPDKPGKWCHAPFLAEQPPAADRLQRPLLRRSRFRARLMPGVDMTSDVKGGQQIFLSLQTL